jgi:predicted 3-demethylubiquinone-9 3-methyltransferase (glyoxalase superfamily)
MNKITPFLWFNNNAKEAADYYCSIFKNSRIIDVSYEGKSEVVFSVSFELEGQAFHALNGGPYYSFTPAISLFVDCEAQDEVNTLWDKLIAGGEPSRCGWLKDQFGLSWQIIPKQLRQLMRDPDPIKSKRVVDAMMQMIKIDIKTLEQAYANN